MPLIPQTANDAGTAIHGPSWSNEISSLFSLANFTGMRRGARLGFPMASNQPTTGLLPTLTAGSLLYGASRVDINPAEVASASANWTNRKIWYGLNGFYYSGADNLAKNTKDVLLGEISTDNAGSPSIIAIAQSLNLGAGRFGIRAAVNLAVAVDGADTDLFTWLVPAEYDYVRLDRAQSRMMSVVTAGNTAGDDHLLKLKVDAASAATIVTTAVAGLTVAGTTTIATPDDADAYSFYRPGTIKVQYNQTDTATVLAGGWIEHILEFSLL